MMFAYGSIAVYHPHQDPTTPPDVGSAWGGGGYVLMESRDLGQHWAEAGFAGIENNPQFGNAFIKGVHLWQDLSVLVGHQRIEHPMGTEENYPGAEVNLDLQAWMPSPALDGQVFLALPWPAESSLETVSAWMDHAGIVSLYTQSYDMVERTLAFTTLVNDLPCAPWFVARQGQNRGGGGVGHCYSQDGAELCQVSVVSGTITVRCMSRVMIPAGLMLSSAMASTPGGDYSVFGDGENSWAVQIQEDGSLSKIRLGPGVYVGDAGHLHPYFGGLVALRTEAGTRLVDLTWGGAFQEVILPQTPCGKGSSCGRYASLEAAVPVGEDKYLCFYAVDSFRYPQIGSHHRLYASVEKATRKPLEGGDFAPWPDGGAALPAYPHAMPASPLQRQCLAAERCMPGSKGWQGQEWRVCLGDWMPSTSMSNPGLDQFLSASPTDCYSLLASYPQRSRLFTTPCKVGCQGDTLIAECANLSGTMDPSVLTVTQAINCRVYGSMCRVDPETGVPACTDGSAHLEAGTCTEKGGAVYHGAANHLVVHNCPELGGQACYPNPQGGVYKVCGYPPCDPPSWCDGDVVRNCIEGWPDIRTDCSISNRDCVSNGLLIQCVTPQVSDPDLVMDICEGDYLIFRGGQRGEVRFLNCKDLGGTCDDSNPQRPVCR
jgi:hypothetical protein